MQMRIGAVLWSAVLVAFLVAGCGGNGGGKNCGVTGDSCGSTSDCCGVLSCISDVCGEPACAAENSPCTNPNGTLAGSCCTALECINALCVAPVSACETLDKACGTSAGNECCSGLKCTNGTCAAPPTCNEAGAFCTAATASTCCQNLTCPRYGTKCALGDIGDPCSANGDCLSGLYCNGWCTRACASNADCVTLVDSPAGVNDCVEATTGFICFPFCQSASQCTIYGAGLGCAPGNAPGGGQSVNVCG